MIVNAIVVIHLYWVSFQIIPMEIPIIKREYRNGMYGVVSALIPRFILELPYLVVLSLIQWLIVWLMTGRDLM